MIPEDKDPIKKQMFDRDENPTVDSQKKEPGSVETQMFNQDENPPEGLVVVQPGKDKNNTPPVPPMATAPTDPIKLSRKDRMAQQDKDNLRIEAGKRNIDLDNLGKEELTDDYKTRIHDATTTAAGKDLADKHFGFMNLLTPPPNVPVPTLDQKALLESEKRQRRARFSDALTAFGEGLQGKTANPENFASTRIQRARDKEFQDYKDATQKNKNTKWAWENKNTDDVMNWVDEQLKNEKLDANTKEKFQQIKDKNAQDQKNKDRGFKIQEDKNNILRNKKPGGTAKEDRDVNVMTNDGKVHKLTKVEADFEYSNAISNPETLKDDYDRFFVKKDKLDRRGRAIPGEYTYEKRPEVTTNMIIKSSLEHKQKKY